MPREHYTAIIFQTKAHAFSNDAHLSEKLRSFTGKDDIKLKRENYADDRWSGWFSIKPERTDAWELGHAMEKMPGLGSVMLRTSEGKVVSLHTAPKFATGAIINRKPPRL